MTVNVDTINLLLEDIHTSLKSVEYALVMLESMAGTGHKITRIKPRGGDKISVLFRDPWVQQTVLYKEKLRLRSIQYEKLPNKLTPIGGR